MVVSPLAQKQNGERCLAESSRAVEDGVEDWPVIGRRAADGAQDVAGGSLALERLAELLGAGLGAFSTLEQDPACVNVIDVDECGGAIVRLVNFTPWSAVKCGLHLTTMERLFVDFTRKMGGAHEA